MTAVPHALLSEVSSDDARLDALEATDVATDTRLDAVEGDVAATVLGNLGSTETITPTGKFQHYLGTLDADTAITLSTLTAGQRAMVTLKQNIFGWWAPTLTYGPDTIALDVEKGQDATTTFEITTDGTDLIVMRLDGVRGSVLFTASNRSYKDCFTNYAAADKSRFADVASPFRAGKTAIQIALNSGDVYGVSTDFNANPATFSGLDGSQERAELCHGNPVGPHSLLAYEGDRWFIGMGLKIPAATWASGSGFNFIFQAKQIGDLVSPALVLSLKSPYRLSVYTADTPRGNAGITEKWHATLTPDVWVKVVLDVFFHRDPQFGYFQVYGDMTAAGGALTALSPRTYCVTMKDPDTSASWRGSNVGSDEVIPRTHWRLGNYRTPGTANAVHIVDGFTIATTRAKAEAVAFT